MENEIFKSRGEKLKQQDSNEIAYKCFPLKKMDLRWMQKTETNSFKLLHANHSSRNQPSRVPVKRPIERAQSSHSILPAAVMKSDYERTLCYSPSKSIECSQKWTTLILEDEPTMGQYLCQELAKLSRVVRKKNTLQALQWVESEKSVDLIVLDATRLDSNTEDLLNKIRGTNQLCEIPVLLLLFSSGLDLESRAKYLEFRVEDYLVKPFYNTELLVRTKGLLKASEARRKSKHWSSKVNQSDPNNSIDDDKLMTKVRCILARRLANSKYNMTALARELAIGKTNLLLGIMRATGMNLNQYIKEFRLQQARKNILTKKSTSLIDACSSVGLENPSYFSKLYFDRFGIKPFSTLHSFC
ncbi:MAG: helix-turn-helix domain-containing protein [Reichenbachiella sp.]|uniref:response regulator transcription factor n=1 Tax=Reichenbachiella sp. TaxID=2184521 RepID=UPI003265CC58